MYAKFLGKVPKEKGAQEGWLIKKNQKPNNKPNTGKNKSKHPQLTERLGTNCLIVQGGLSAESSPY